MNNIIYPFQIPIYQSFIDINSFIQIKKDVDDYIKTNQNIFHQPWNCNTLSTYGLPLPIQIYSEVLNEKIKSSIEEYYKFWNYPNSFSVEIGNYWLNIAKKGSYQEVHHHSDSLFSGVVYLNVNEESGNFNLVNPLSSESILLKEPPNFNLTYNVTPQNGMIIIFPGWMLHRVLSNNSNIDRISMSFNTITNFN